LLDRKAPCKPLLLNATHRAVLVNAIAPGPTPAVHCEARWRIIDLASSTRRKAFGRSCATTGYRTGCSTPTRLLRRLEQAGREAMAQHLRRTPRPGARVLIN